mgnify:CR=1 FL=1
MVKLTNENYAIKKNLEGLKDLLEKEQKDKTELEATCSLDRENFQQQLQKLEKAINPLLDDNDQVAFSFMYVFIACFHKSRIFNFHLFFQEESVFL